MQAAQLLNCCNWVLGQLVYHASLIGCGRAGGSTPADLAQEAAAAVRQLLQQLMAAAWDAATPPAERARLLLLSLPAAEQLAAILKQHEALPELAQARQLELARAAAGRSCAYLCCSNLQGGSGPAAGQGEGSMRCR